MSRRRTALVADLFCGAGGSSTGARRALAARGIAMELVAVNHWPVAIETHQKNHPEARHYCQDVEAAKPLEIVPEGKLDLLMASPTCTFHSRARGGKPIHDQQRMDPWAIVRWCTELRVRRLLVENVPEFVEWGPLNLTTGRPISSRKGEYFRAWLHALGAIGGRYDHRIINCADHGDATTRQRFFLICRFDERRLRWPEPTHAPASRADMLGLMPWRAAREVIDWSSPGQSIFARKRPLSPNTMRRIAAGLRKFGGPMASAFLVVLRRHCDALALDEPLPAICAAGTHLALAEPRVVPFVVANGHGERGGPAPRSTGEPLATIAAGGIQMGVVEAEAQPFLLNRHGENGGTRVHSVDEPIPTATSRGAGYLAEPEAFVLSMASGGGARPVREPIPTMVAKGGGQLIQPFVFPANQGEGRERGLRSVDQPLPTIVTRDSLAVAEPFLLQVNHGDGPRDGANRRARSIEEPMPTITASRGEAVVQPFIAPYYGSGSGETGKSTEEPLDTVTTRGRFGLVEPAAFLVPQFGEREGQEPRTHAVDDPVPTVTSHGAGALIEPVMVQTDQTGSNGICARPITEPLATLVTKRNVGLVEPTLKPLDGGDVDLSRLVLIDGQPYLLDIRFRMLKNPELARAMGFDADEIEYEFFGTGEQVTRQIGNAIPVHTATALEARAWRM